MKQAVERVDRVEGVGREVQGREIYHACREALALAELDHLGRQVGADYVEAVIPEELAVLPWTGAELQQGTRLATEHGQEAQPLLGLPRLDGTKIPLPRLAVVGLAQTGSQLVSHNGPV